MNKKILIILLSILISLCFAFGVYELISYKSNELELRKLVKSITKNTELMDLNEHHNQALDVADYAKNKGIEIPSILINFDTHSDIYLNYIPKDTSIAGIDNWINILLIKNPNIEEIYWVIPDEEALYEPLQKVFALDEVPSIETGQEIIFDCNSVKEDLDWLYFVKTPLTKEVYKQEFYIDTKTSYMNEITDNKELAKKMFKSGVPYKKIKITTCTAQTLPDFKGKKVFLSIDADYISNCGYDTTEDLRFIKSSKSAFDGMVALFDTLQTKHVAPTIISMTISPQYLPKSLHKFMNKVFRNIIEFADKEDCIDKYINTYMYHYEIGEKFE